MELLLIVLAVVLTAGALLVRMNRNHSESEKDSPNTDSVPPVVEKIDQLVESTATVAVTLEVPIAPKTVTPTVEIPPDVPVVLEPTKPARKPRKPSARTKKQPV